MTDQYNKWDKPINILCAKSGLLSPYHTVPIRRVKTSSGCRASSPSAERWNQRNLQSCLNLTLFPNWGLCQSVGFEAGFWLPAGTPRGSVRSQLYPQTFPLTLVMLHTAGGASVRRRTTFPSLLLKLWSLLIPFRIQTHPCSYEYLSVPAISHSSFSQPRWTCAAFMNSLDKSLWLDPFLAYLTTGFCLFSIPHSPFHSFPSNFSATALHVTVGKLYKVFCWSAAPSEKQSNCWDAYKMRQKTTVLTLREY